jgi:hypothetical protein
VFYRGEGIRICRVRGVVYSVLSYHDTLYTTTQTRRNTVFYRGEGIRIRRVRGVVYSVLNIYHTK